MAARSSLIDEAIKGPGTADTQSRMGLRLREAAKAIGISERSLWALTKAGKVPHFRIGRSLIYPIEQLKKWIADQASSGSEVQA